LHFGHNSNPNTESLNVRWVLNIKKTFLHRTALMTAIDNKIPIIPVRTSFN
jgi:hypothetical protein